MTTPPRRPSLSELAWLDRATRAVSPYRPIHGRSYLQTRLADTTTPGGRPPSVAGALPTQPTCPSLLCGLLHRAIQSP